MDFSLKSSVNSSVAAHTGYSWKGSPPDLRGPTVSSDPHGRNHQVHSDYIRPIASSRELRTDHWVQRQGKNPDGFPGPPAASGPNCRQSQPLGIGDRAPIPAAKPTHIRQGLTILKPSYEDRWNNIEFENDFGFSSPGPRQPQLVGPERGGLGAFRQDQDVPPSGYIRSLHGIYDNSWYSPSPPPYCARAESDGASYLSIRPETDTSQNPVSLCYSVSVCLSVSVSLSLSLTLSLSVCLCLSVSVSVSVSLCLCLCLCLSLSLSLS